MGEGKRWGGKRSKISRCDPPPLPPSWPACLLKVSLLRFLQYCLRVCAACSTLAGDWSHLLVGVTRLLYRFGKDFQPPWSSGGGGGGRVGGGGGRDNCAPMMRGRSTSHSGNSGPRRSGGGGGGGNLRVVKPTVAAAGASKLWPRRFTHIRRENKCNREKIFFVCFGTDNP